jgi:hypothetical protein
MAPPRRSAVLATGNQNAVELKAVSPERVLSAGRRVDKLGGPAGLARAAGQRCQPGRVRKGAPLAGAVAVVLAVTFLMHALEAVSRSSLPVFVIV